jgi:hypothetical protein
MYFEKTRDGQALEDAFRSLNYATYFVESDGKINCCGLGFGNPYWFEDGYADAGRSFMWAMGAVPDFAPVGQDHILRSSSIVQMVKYEKHSVVFRTFDNGGTSVLRLSFKPARITAGSTSLVEQKELKQDGYTIRVLTGGDYEIRVRYSGSKDVRIQ